MRSLRDENHAVTRPARGILKLLTGWLQWAVVSSLILALVLALILTTRTVGAEHGPHIDETAVDPSVLTLQTDIDSRAALRRGLGYQVKTKASELGNELGSHLSLVTGDLLDLEFDVHNQHANIRIGAMSKSAMQINGDIRVTRSVARIRGSLALAVNGKTYRLELPVFELASRDVQGERSLEVRLPIVEGTF